MSAEIVRSVRPSVYLTTPSTTRQQAYEFLRNLVLAGFQEHISYGDWATDWTEMESKPGREKYLYLSESFQNRSGTNRLPTK